MQEGEKYENPGTQERKSRAQEKTKFLTPTGFVPSSPPKRATGPGTYFGTIGGVFTHEKEYDTEKPRSVSPQPRNILTSPSKKGTFGVPGTTISKGSEWQYEPDPYEAARKKEIEERKSASKLNVSGPFKSMSHSLDFFDSHKSVAASMVYTMDRPMPEKKDTSPKKIPIEKPFKPSSPPKSGYNSTLQKFPSYTEDPYARKEELEREERKKTKPTVVFKPVSNPKSSPTKSIMFH